MRVWSWSRDFRTARGLLSAGAAAPPPQEDPHVTRQTVACWLPLSASWFWKATSAFLLMMPVRGQAGHVLSWALSCPSGLQTRRGSCGAARPAGSAVPCTGVRARQALRRPERAPPGAFCTLGFFPAAAPPPAFLGVSLGGAPPSSSGFRPGAVQGLSPGRDRVLRMAWRSPVWRGGLWREELLVPTDSLDSFLREKTTKR